MSHYYISERIIVPALSVTSRSKFAPFNSSFSHSAMTSGFLDTCCHERAALK